MERLFDATWGQRGPEAYSGVFPAMNVTRDAENYYVRAELPGIAADELEISVENNKLTVAGERLAKDEEGVSYHRRERASGSFSRTLTLPAAFDSGGVQANYIDGLLTIVLPVAESARPRQIDVQTA